MADAPAPAPAVDDVAARAAKRQRLATTELQEWKPPAVTHTWTLEDLTVASFTDAALGIEWLGPEFVACGLRWRLFVQPKKLRAADNEVVLVLFLRLLDRTSAPVNLAEATLRIRGLGEHKLSKAFSLITEHGSPTVVAACGYSVSHSKFVSKSVAALQGGRMVFTAVLRGRSYAQVSVASPSAPPLANLIAASLPAPGAELDDSVDVVFKAADGERFGAHSFILALRSSTLRASIRGPLAAGARRRVTAASASLPRELDVPEGISAVTFRRVLSFMYHDVLPAAADAPLSTSDLHALLHAADYLDVPRLRQLCAAELHTRLAPDNAVATLKLAHALSCGSLLDAALRFIAANAPAVMRAPGWAELAHEVSLMQAVLSTMATGEPPVMIAEPLQGQGAEAAGAEDSGSQ